MDIAAVVEGILSHHGVKGMKWGVRKDRGAQSVTVLDRRKRIKTTGGAGHPAHVDAVRARTVGQIGKKSGLKALSDEELRSYATRLNLEQQAKRLQYNDASPPVKFVKHLLGQTGKNTAQNVANDVAGQQVKKHLAKVALLAA